METWGFISTFTFPTLILPLYSFESSSITGPIARQGPHHSAQKSITVNLSDDNTFSWKFESVNSAAITVILILLFIVYSQIYNQMQDTLKSCLCCQYLYTYVPIFNQPGSHFV